MPRLHQMESLLLVVVSVVNVKMNKNIHKTTKIFLRIKMCQLSSFLVLSAFSFSSSFDLNIFLFCANFLHRKKCIEFQTISFDEWKTETANIANDFRWWKVFSPEITRKNLINIKNIITKEQRRYSRIRRNTRSAHELAASPNKKYQY